MHPSLQKFMPQRMLSSLAGFLASSKNPWLKTKLIRYFLSRHTVELSEAKEPNPFAYVSFNDFFTRALKASARPIAEAPSVLVSPADGTLSEHGSFNSGTLIQAKGKTFTVNSLLGEEAPEFQQGTFFTVYLAPHNYHRVHIPLAGHLTKTRFIPGKLYSVNLVTSAKIPNLFAQNERLVCFFNTDFGQMAVVFVGAMLVGSMETVWSGIVKGSSIQTDRLKETHTFTKGAEIGRFKMGSTVIVLVNNPNFIFDSNLDQVQFGQKIGEFKPDRS